MLVMNSDGSCWRMKHYTMHFIMLQCTISRPLNEIQRLYKTGHNLRQYDMFLKRACSYLRNTDYLILMHSCITQYKPFIIAESNPVDPIEVSNEDVLSIYLDSIPVITPVNTITEDKTSLSSGAIAGIAIAVSFMVISIIIIVAVGMFCFCRHRQFSSM